MKYLLYKLHFSTPVHFGGSDSARSLESAGFTYCADTFFSALCHIAAKMNCLEPLLDAVQKDELRFTDGMPWDDGDLYLPKPLLPPGKLAGQMDNRKQMNRLKYIPLQKFAEYLAYCRGEGSFSLTDIRTVFAEKQLVTKVSLRGEQPEPYSVAAYHFYETCGLYGLIGYRSEEAASLTVKLLGMLGLEGMGGKVTAGYGKFQVVETTELENASEKSLCLLRDMLTENGTRRQMLLTASLPEPDVLADVIQDACYQLIRRGGFVYFGHLTAPEKKQIEPVKKDTQYFFAAGSVFRKKYDGMVYSVGHNLSHPVYRYGKPIFLEVPV